MAKRNRLNGLKRRRDERKMSSKTICIVNRGDSISCGTMTRARARTRFVFVITFSRIDNVFPTMQEGENNALGKRSKRFNEMNHTCGKCSALLWLYTPCATIHISFSLPTTIKFIPPLKTYCNDNHQQL